MNYDKYGIAYTTEEELCDILYANPTQDLKLFKLATVDGKGDYNRANEEYYKIFEPIIPYLPIDFHEEVPIELFDHYQQQNWYMPDVYKNMDIAQWILDQCKNDAELQRVGQELLLYQERNLFDLLRYLKYFVDTMRSNNVLWGLGRGSSVASYVLYLIGVHKINSIYYDLPIEEFLK